MTLFKTYTKTCALTVATLAVFAGLSFSGAQAADKTLTIYTYESFTSEWGPGPKVKAAFEKTCGCTVNFVSVADGVALLSRLKLEGRHQGRCRARPRHQPDHRGQGDRPVRCQRRRYQ
jgi:thiamine transport system substrate-binding protein